MTRIAFLDCRFGAAGDMLLAACLDAVSAFGGLEMETHDASRPPTFQPTAHHRARTRRRCWRGWGASRAGGGVGARDEPRRAEPGKEGSPRTHPGREMGSWWWCCPLLTASFVCASTQGHIAATYVKVSSVYGHEEVPIQPHSHAHAHAHVHGEEQGDGHSHSHSTRTRTRMGTKGRGRSTITTITISRARVRAGVGWIGWSRFLGCISF